MERPSGGHVGKRMKLVDCLNDCIYFIFTDQYEDPALSEELELQTRAWHTMYANLHEFADIINRVLMKLNITFSSL